MSQSQDTPLIGDDAIEVFRHHISAKIAKAAATGKNRAVETGSSSDENMISFDEVHGMLLPRDKEKYEELGTDATGRLGVQRALQTVQTLIFTTNKAGEIEEQVKKSKEVEKMLQVELNDLTSGKAESDALVLELQEELTRQNVNSGRLQAALAEVETLKLKLARSGTTIAMAAKAAEVKTKAKMMHDWENNKTSTWNIEEIYADAEELKKLEAMDPDLDLDQN